MASLSVVIVNWNTKELLRECLEAVYTINSVIVVDNGSTDGSVDLVKNNFPASKLIANTENMGFGAANNQAIKVTQSEYILFLNTDAAPEKDAISRLIEFMDSNPKAALCSGTLVRADGSIQDTFGPYPTLATEFLGRSLLRLLFPSRYTPRSLQKKKGPQKADSIRGACMLARRSSIEDIGGFSERYFLFLEETDLCLRLNKKGYQIWWVPEVNVYHKGGGSGNTKSASARVEYWRSRYIFFHKYYPAWKCRVLKFGLLLKLSIDWTLNLIGSIAKPCRRKLKSYSTIILWHILGCPGYWGLGSGNTVKIDNALVRKGFESWWEKNKEDVLRQGDIIKDSGRRSLTDYKGEVYIKKYKARSSLLREWQLILRLRQLGIPTVTPIAAGKGFLITQKLTDVKNIHDFVLENVEKLSFQEKLDLTRSLAGFINKLHRKGLYHGDLHAGNILIKCSRAGLESPEQFYITDLHRAKLKMWLSKRQILKNLVQLNVFFSLQTNSTERLRFLKYYMEGNDYKRYARIIENRTRCACQKLWDKRDRLYLKKRRYGIKGAYKGMRYIINSRYKDLELRKVLPYLKPGSTGNPLKDSRSTYLCMLELPDLGKIVLKIHRQKRFVNYIKDLWRSSRAFRSWRGSWALITRCISTPEPILAMEKRHLRILKESLIVYRSVDSAENLTVWINKNWENRTLMFKKHFIDRLAYFVRTIHSRGISPCDLKGSNVLVQENGDKIIFYLVDLDHLERRSSVSSKKRLRNIAQLDRTCAVSAAMGWRFLKRYFHKKDLNEQKEIARRL